MMTDLEYQNFLNEILEEEERQAVENAAWIKAWSAGYNSPEEMEQGEEEERRYILSILAFEEDDGFPF